MYTFFYSHDCPHCATMLRNIAKLEVEFEIFIEKINIDGDERAYRKMANVATSECSGVPLLVHASSADVLCGETSYRALKYFFKKTTCTRYSM